MKLVNFKKLEVGAMYSDMCNLSHYKNTIYKYLGVDANDMLMMKHISGFNRFGVKDITMLFEKNTKFYKI